MAKTTIEVEVEVKEITNEKDVTKAFQFVSIKLPGGQAIPLPPDVPAPRRMARDFAAAAGYKLRGEQNPNVPVEPTPAVVSMNGPDGSTPDKVPAKVVVNPSTIPTPNPGK